MFKIQLIFTQPTPPAAALPIYYIDGLVQGCSISIANAMEILQSCTKSSICDQQNQFGPVSQ